MSLTCTRCSGSGFLNLEQSGEDAIDSFNEAPDFHDAVLKWIMSNEGHDVMVCDCCGNGESWYGVPGEHYNADDPPGKNGPYVYNGGLCRCH